MSGSSAMTVLEIGELAGAAPHVDAVAVDDGNARRVVAAILEPPQPLDQDGDDGLVADVADDAAHISVNRSVAQGQASALAACQP